MSDYKYRAFISYSHADQKWGRWLHKALETFKVPKELVGQETAVGVTPKRLGKVFRDDDELGTHADLGAKITAALQDSDVLIVVCSPNSAKSQWVNQEIHDFKKLGRPHRVFALIVEGEPHAAEPAEECFPNALKYTLAEDGTLSDEPAEPLPTDVRKFGKEDSLLRLVSGLLDVDYDVLKNRERIRVRQQARRARALFSGGALLFAIGAIATVLATVQSKSVVDARSLLFAEKATQLSDNFRYDAAMLWALGGLAAPTNLIKSDDTQAMAQFRRAFRRNLVLEGHGNWVVHAAFSPDGTRIVTASRDNTARLWDAETGALITPLEGHGNWVVHAAFSPDGTRIVTASHDNTARLWDAETGALITPLEGHGNWVVHAAFSSDGTRIVTASHDDTARLWDAETGALITPLEGHGARVVYAAFSPDGARIVTASRDDTARLWDAETGALIIPLEGHGGDVVHAAFSSDGTRIVTASDDDTARLWDAETGALIIPLEGHGGDVVHAAFSSDGTRIVTASDDDTARLWDAMAGPYTWSREDMFRLGCERKELNGRPEYTEVSPILSGLSVDGTPLRDPCDRHGLKSPKWWRVKAEQAWQGVSRLWD